MNKVHTYIASGVTFVLLVILLILERLYPAGGAAMLQGLIG